MTDAPDTRETLVTVMRHDFGQIDQGEVVAHEFQIAHTGDEEWVFSQPTTACPQCTEVELEAFRLSPGESTTLKLTFSSVHSPGPFEFETKVPREGKEALRFVIAGVVTEVLTWEPDYIDLSEGDVARVVIRSERFEKGMEVVGVAATEDGVEVEPVDLEGVEQVFQIDGSGVPAGKVINLLFQTNDEQIPDFPVAVVRPE